MSSTFYDGKTPLAPNTTLVAVDKDKNSSYAFRWAVNHLDNPLVLAVHVKHKDNICSRRYPLDLVTVYEPDEDDVANVFGNLRGLCNRKAVQVKEAVIHESDVVRGIVEFASKNFIHTIVVGAPANKGALSRFIYLGHQTDVPTALLKSAPNFSSVYVISKWKIVSVRSATRAIQHALAPPRTPPRLWQSPPSTPTPSRQPQSKSQPVMHHYPHSEPDMGGTRGISFRDKPMSAGNSPLMGNIFEDTPPHLRHFSMDDCREISMDHNQTTNFSFSSEFSSTSISSSTRDIDAEIRRLKQELQQTIDLYSTACKQAISAKKEAEMMRHLKMEGERRVEAIRMSQEAALAIAEREKARATAAWEMAEDAKKRAELEAQRRRDAELKAAKEAEEKEMALTALAHTDMRCRRYTMEEIEAATEKFNPSRKIGEGGYGSVYKGDLENTPVAIKVLNPEAAQGRKQFQQEVEVLSCIRHPNMVLLLGACPESGCLVYEYMDNGTLEDRLFRKDNSPPMPWRLRFNIAADIATALLFLHQAKPEPIVHRDLKPANILLDRNYVTKIADIGLARLVPQSVVDNVTQYYMTSAAGTFCYIDPEYQQTGILTPKSDVYSLGVVLLQIITAKPAMGLSHHVRRAISKEKFEDMLDPMVFDWPVEKALEFANLALACCELRKKDRPNLATVVLPELNRLREFGR
ncbi:U-box domain-containing protein 52-like [Arachis duranensis]|uniref:RING-type E3 ubiquitin transferase n=1 Tax=Arachis duranensis TaxID=130453 RepID=A0A9C6T896_ARADU|nr:U-box domain-containing protein 52-like [Arachis duranensis]